MPPSARGSDQPDQRSKVARSFGADAERYDRARPGYPRALVDHLVSLMPGTQILDVGIGTGLSAAEGIRRAGAFGKPARVRFDWQAAITRDHWLDQVPTFGGHNRIPEDSLDALRSGMAAVIDSAGGSFTMNYATIAITALAGLGPEPGPETPAAAGPSPD